MNNLFDLQRFTLLVRKHWVEQGRIYLFSWLTLAGILACFFLMNYNNLSENFQEMLLIMSLLLSISVFSSMMFADLADKTRGILYLTIPVSHLEKLLCSLFYSIVFFIPVFFATFFLIDFIFIGIYNSTKISGQMYVINLLERQNTIKILPVVFFNIQALFTLGSIYFGKNAYIKTAGFLFITAIILLYTNFSILDKFIDHRDNIVGRSIGYTITMKDFGYNETLLKNFLKLIRFCITYVTAPFFWLVTFFRIKEKQI
jgi:hypothetical protein